MTIHFSDGSIGVVSQDTGEFIRYVDAQRIAYTIPRRAVTSRFRYNKPYYRFIGSENDIIYSTNLIPKDVEAFEKLVKNQIYH